MRKSCLVFFITLLITPAARGQSACALLGVNCRLSAPSDRPNPSGAIISIEKLRKPNTLPPYEDRLNVSLLALARAKGDRNA